MLDEIVDRWSVAGDIQAQDAHSLGTIDKYSCCESCCTFDPGSFCCCNAKQPNSICKLELCLYFKFMKHAILILIVTLTLLVCCVAAMQNGFNPTADYQTFLYFNTLRPYSS
jgi:hypothetical protein